MQDVDRWAAYARLQKQLATRHAVDDHMWGLEAGLNALTAEPDDALTSASEADRTCASEARRERHRLTLLRRHHQASTTGTPYDTDEQLAAVRTLRTARARVNDDDWHLLTEVAAGQEYANLAGLRGESSGALRARVLRLRRFLSAA